MKKEQENNLTDRDKKLLEMIQVMINESKTHSEILLYGIEEKIKLLAEGLSMTNENLERFKEYVEKRFNELSDNMNMLIMRDSPSRSEFEVVKKQVRKLDKEVFG